MVIGVVWLNVYTVIQLSKNPDDDKIKYLARFYAKILFQITLIWFILDTFKIFHK